ncbi:MAG: type I-E CRISPR-associated protein Cas7/Cse4/CasC [Candidatus Methanoperedenaceae archaeon]|nr:type I-E CRISPR-associated protein Cas7/Cse4/CasC [Candidatus Methanoperedenaceae archaeon]MDW7725510.1 type I-E CRISPR-associated protein Cas7/Cse4/CasC [Candidatus Methanoperedens sp.]
MSEFIQLHILASYPPSNLNRDDLGRPKTAVMGGTQRLRISSQSLKRAWRESDIFKESLSGHIGIRTKEMGVYVCKALTSGCSLVDTIKNEDQINTKFPPVSESMAKKYAQDIAGVFGKVKTTKKGKDEEDKDKDTKETENDPFGDLKLEQLAHFSQEEIILIDSLLGKLAKSGDEPTKDDLQLLREKHTAADIAMFGRMLASSPMHNTEAAVQVSHPITVHKVAVEDDYFTAVDDLNDGSDNSGAAHIGELEFASGLFYNYVCINRTLLAENLGGDKELVNKALKALVEAAAKVAPTGKQNSFASRAYASYILAEKGTQQPRSLSVAFLKALNGKDILDDSISALKATNENMVKVYGKCSESNCEMNAHTGEGSLDEILGFVAK